MQIMSVKLPIFAIDINQGFWKLKQQRSHIIIYIGN